MAKLFTLKEAEGLIPSLEQWLPEAIKARRRAVEADQAIQKVVGRVQVLGGMELDPRRISRFKREKERAVQQLRENMRQIEECGCLLKDLDVGLIDFPSMMDGEQVLLCWKLGETRIEYWHRSDEGFAGRKRIDDGPGPAGKSSKPN